MSSFDLQQRTLWLSVKKMAQNIKNTTNRLNSNLSKTFYNFFFSVQNNIDNVPDNNKTNILEQAMHEVRIQHKNI